MQHLVTHDGQHGPDTAGPLVPTTIVTIFAPLYRIVGEQEVKVLLLLTHPDLLAMLMCHAKGKRDEQLFQPS
jgi:hypothetical protein